MMAQVTWGRFLHAVDSRAILLLFLGCVSFSTATISVPWDLLGYMTHALNIINGHGYAYIDGQPVLFRGPVFSLLIALSFKIFGVSPESAFHVIRLFCIANPVLIYLFGKKLFNAEVGFFAALLVLTSYSLSFWSYRHLDAVWPFFAILHCYFLYEGFEKKKILFFVLAGISLGIAYLTKEVALLFFPLGLLMCLWIKEYRTIENLKFIFFSLLMLVVTILPWALYLRQHDGLHFLWGAGGPKVLGDMVVERQGGESLFGKFLEGVEQYSSAFAAFYSAESKNTVAANFTLAPLFLLSWLFIVCKSFFGDKKSKILVLNIFLFLPIIYFIGKNHWRFGQVLHTMLISYLALSFMSFSCIEWTCKLLNRSKVTMRVVCFIFAIVLCLIQVFALSRSDLGYKQFFKNSLCYNFINGEKTETEVLGGFSNPYLAEVIEKLNEISELTDGVLVNFSDNARVVFLKTGGKQYVNEIPRLTYSENGLQNISERPYLNNDRAVIIWSFFRPSDSRFSIFMIFEKQLDKLIEEKNIKYILLSPNYPVYNRYFAASKKFERVLVAGPKGRHDKCYYLYRVNLLPQQEEMDVLPVFTTNHLTDSLKLLRLEMPEKFRSFQSILLDEFTGLTSEDLEKILGD